MKRLLLAAAMCCISLVSCDNEPDFSDLSPLEWEILELDNLIASQSGFDEEALIADLTRGTMKINSHYILFDGSFDKCIIAGQYPGALSLFFDNGICKDCYNYIKNNPDPNANGDLITGSSYSEYDWKYDSDTYSIITYSPFIGKETSAKILYYNTEDHRLILEGTIFMLHNGTFRLSGYIDVDPAERERIIEKYCNE